MAAFAPETTDVVILCGGRGTRLGAISAHRPKPLLPVGGRPFLLHVLLRLKEEGFARIILAAHYLAEQFEVFVRAHEDLGLELRLLVEPEPLGTGGALRHAAQFVRSPVFLAMNGDSWFEPPIAPVLAAHRSAGCALTLVVARADQVEGAARQKGLVRVGPRGELLGFHTTDITEGWVNAGLYILDSAMVRGWPEGTYSFEERVMQLVPPGQGRVFCSTCRLLDIGTPECYARTNESGLVTGALR